MPDSKDPPKSEPVDRDEPHEPPPPFRPQLDLIGDADREQRATVEERRKRRGRPKA